MKKVIEATLLVLTLSCIFRDYKAFFKVGGKTSWRKLAGRGDRSNYS